MPANSLRSYHAFRYPPRGRPADLQEQQLAVDVLVVGRGHHIRVVPAAHQQGAPARGTVVAQLSVCATSRVQDTLSLRGTARKPPAKPFNSQPCQGSSKPVHQPVKGGKVAAIYQRSAAFNGQRFLEVDEGAPVREVEGRQRRWAVGYRTVWIMPPSHSAVWQQAWSSGPSAPICQLLQPALRGLQAATLADLPATHCCRLPQPPPSLTCAAPAWHLRSQTVSPRCT